MKTDMHSASVSGRDLPISTKHAIVISKYIRGRKISWARDRLNEVLKFKTAVPFTVRRKDIGHRKGHMGPGRYPQKAAKEFIKLLNSVEANAQNKGLDANELYITTIVPNMASRPMHPGRQMRTKMKRTHIDIIAEEKIKEKKEAIKKKENKK